MVFRRFLAIILLLILPLQSTLAAVDGCCMATASRETSADTGAATSIETLAAQQDAVAADCCVACDFCQHACNGCATAALTQPTRKQTMAPVARPEPPIYSFIPDLPPRPDLAA